MYPVRWDSKYRFKYYTTFKINNYAKFKCNSVWHIMTAFFLTVNFWKKNYFFFQKRMLSSGKFREKHLFKSGSWQVFRHTPISSLFLLILYSRDFYVIIHARNIPTSLSTQTLSQWMKSPPYTMAAILWHVDKMLGLQAMIEEPSPAHTSSLLPSLNYFYTFNYSFLQWLKLYSLNMTLSYFVKKYLFQLEDFHCICYLLFKMNVLFSISMNCLTKISSVF